MWLSRIPRPCVHLSYYVPQYFVEVADQAKESFFFALPGVATQLATSKEILPFGAQDDEGAYSFHARTINVPFTLMGFAGMPCGGFLWDNMCFTCDVGAFGGQLEDGVGGSVSTSVDGLGLSTQGLPYQRGGDIGNGRGAIYGVSGPWGFMFGGSKLDEKVSSKQSGRMPWMGDRFPSLRYGYKLRSGDGLFDGGI